MTLEVRMPKLGQIMVSGKITKWLKKEGEIVQKGEPLLEIMTDKVTTQIEAAGTGLVQQILVPVGKQAKVGATLAVIALGEPANGGEVSLPPEPQAAGLALLPSFEQSTVVTVTNETQSQQREKELASAGLALLPSWDSTVPALAPTGESRASALRVALAGEKHPSSPAARRVAKEHGVDVSLVPASRTGARVTGEDVLAYLAVNPKVASPAMKGQPVHESRAGLAAPDQVTILVEADFTEMLAYQENLAFGFELATGVQISYLDLLAKIVGIGLQQYQLTNPLVASGNTVRSTSINVLVELDAEDDSQAPIIRDVLGKSLAEIARERVQFGKKELDGQSIQQEIEGDLFTIACLGEDGPDLELPSLKPPRIGAIGVGRIVPRPAVANGAVVVRPLCWLSLTFDRKVVDRKSASRFLRAVAEMVVAPGKYVRTALRAE